MYPALCQTLYIFFVCFSFFLSFFFFFLPHWAVCGILVPQQGIEPLPLAVEDQSPKHWTTRKVPVHVVFNTAALWSQY